MELQNLNTSWQAYASTYWRKMPHSQLMSECNSFSPQFPQFIYLLFYIYNGMAGTTINPSTSAAYIFTLPLKK